jgi:ESCRT-II complex subunit VPS36
LIISFPQGKSVKVVLHLAPKTTSSSGPVSSSQFNFIKISFRDGGATEFQRNLDDARRGRKWEQVRSIPSKPAAKPRGQHAGIVGIERKMAAQTVEAERDISQAFADLSQLMVKAKEMVRPKVFILIGS